MKTEKNTNTATEIITDLSSTIVEVRTNLVALEGEALNLARKIDIEVKKLDSALEGGCDMMVKDKIATVEDSLAKAHHVLAAMPVKYELNTDGTKKTEKAYWLFTQKESIDTDISIALDYIEKGLHEISSCEKGGAVNE